MAIQDLGFQAVIPNFLESASGLPSFTNSLNLTATVKAASIISIKKSGNISSISFRTGTTANINNVYKLSIQTVVNGVPSGTLWNAGSEVTGITGLSANSYYTVDLSSSAVVSSGDVIAIVFETTSFTANATIAFFSDGGSGGTGLPFVVHYNGSTWSVPNSAPNWAIKYDDGSFASGLGLFSIKTVNSTNTNSSGMVGNKITPNKTMRVVGFTAWVDLDASTNVIIYGADGATEIANFELSLDYPIASSGIFIYAGYFSSPVTLEEGQTYYIMLKNNSATNVATYDYEAESVNCRLSFDGGEIMSRVTSSTLTPSSPADFTEDSVKLTALGLIIDGIESGGSTSPTETAYAFSC